MADRKTPRRRREDFEGEPRRDEIIEGEEVRNRRDDYEGTRDRRRADYDEVSDRGREDYYDRDRDGYPPRDYYDRRPGNRWIIPLLLLLFFLLAGWYFLNNRNNGTNLYNINQNQQNQEQNMKNEQKTSNFEKSIPEQGQVLPAPPSSVLVQTTSPSSAQGTSITIINSNNNNDYGSGDTLIGSNGTTIRRAMDPGAPEGLYTVNYKTCGNDGNCQQGSYQFQLKRDEIKNYDDQRNKNAATVTLANNEIYPDKLLISKGTKVTFVNNLPKNVTINAGTGGTKNYFTNLSSTISPNSTYSFTFDQIGYFPFNVVSGNDTLNGNVTVQ